MDLPLRLPLDEKQLVDKSDESQKTLLLHEALAKFRHGYYGPNTKAFEIEFQRVTSAISPKINAEIIITVDTKEDIELMRQMVSGGKKYAKDISDFAEHCLYYHLKIKYLFDNEWILKGDSIRDTRVKNEHDTYLSKEVVVALNKYKEENGKKTYDAILKEAINELMLFLDNTSLDEMLKVLHHAVPSDRKNKHCFTYKFLEEKHVDFVTEHINKKPSHYPFPRNTTDFICRCLTWYLKKKGYLK